jgi:dolichyl-phosphate beta-glucosyltransferase
VSDAPLTLSLIIPTYNQRARSVRAAGSAMAFLRERFGERAELIMVDDGSLPTQAMTEAELPPGTALVQHAQNLGKGAAIRSGVARARAEYVVFTDSDLPFSLEPLATTVDWLRDGADIVIGDRLHPESEAAIEVTPARRLSSVVYTLMVKYALGLDYPDTQCGYKGYRAAVAKDLFPHLEVMSFAFDVEILLRARRAGYRVRRQPLRLVHDEDSSVRLTRHAPRMIADILRIAWRARRGRYDRPAR